MSSLVCMYVCLSIRMWFTAVIKIIVVYLFRRFSYALNNYTILYYNWCILIRDVLHRSESMDPEMFNRFSSKVLPSMMIW